MIQDIQIGNESVSKAKVTEGINEMLGCLLNKEQANCRKCKSCNKVDSCCFLMEAVFVYQYNENFKKKTST